ncbi:MAG: universal stress protein, partial [Pseudomonadota bacterium]
VPAEKLHWITLYGEPDSTVAQYACMYDLTLVGKYDAVSGRDNADVHPEQIAMQSGRPVLMVPARPAEGSLHRRAVLAWDGQRAATRALNDAMQLLEADQPVDVISIGDRHVRPPLKGVDVVKALARHDVAATRIRKSEVTDSVGADLLSYCKEVDAGLLVMGAFERSVFREELFGGTTKHVLMHADLPVLISH